MDIFRGIAARVYLLAGDLRDREEGQGMTEYALLLAALIVVGLGAVVIFTGKLSDAFNALAP
jgi:Flp pilus assembly pilin Flp